jgi:hypothetical protein
MDNPNAVPPPPEVMFKMITGYWVSQTVGPSPAWAYATFWSMGLGAPTRWRVK